MPMPLPTSLHLAQVILVSALAIALVGGAVATAARSRYLRELSRRDLLLLGACLVLGLALRLAAKTFVASTSVESGQALGFMNAHRWAAGMSAILRFLSLFVEHLDVPAIAKVNMAVSLASIVAVFTFVDSYFEDRFAAFSAAAVVALQPISARYANSDTTAVLQAFCLLVGATFLARWSRSGGRWLLWQGVGWLVFAAGIRFECVVYFAAGAFLVLGGIGWPTRERARELIGAALLGGIFLLHPIARALMDASGGVFEGSPLGYLGVFLLSPHSPKAVVAVAFLGLVAAILERFRPAVALLFALVVVSVPGNYFPLECAEFPHRFSLPSLAFWAAFAGYGFSAGRRLLLSALGRAPAPSEGPGAIPPIAAAAVIALVAAAAIPHRAYLRQMWTYALEYEFMVPHLKEFPDDCLIVGPDYDREPRGLRSSSHLSAEAGRRHRWLPVTDPEVLAGHIAPCTIYYQATNCYCFEATMEPQNPNWTGLERPACARVHELFDLEPIATTTFPSLRYMCEAHTVDPIPAGFYRMRPKPAGTRSEPSTAPNHASDTRPPGPGGAAR